jgi:hypothetical protein
MDNNKNTSAVAFFERMQHKDLFAFAQELIKQGLKIVSVSIVEQSTISIPTGKDFRQLTIVERALVLVEILPKPEQAEPEPPKMELSKPLQS